MLKILSTCNIFFIDLYRNYNEGEREREGKLDYFYRNIFDRCENT